MRRSAILAEQSVAQWFTTADLARAIERTPRGAQWIADQEDLPCQRTPGRTRLFRKDDVLRLVERRTAARLRNVRALRPKRFGVAGEPRQLSLFAGPRPLSGRDADCTAGVGSTTRAIGPENGGSDKRSLVNRKVVGG